MVDGDVFWFHWCLWYIFILFSHLRLGLPKSYLSTTFSNKTFVAHFWYQNAGHKHHATHLILLDWKTGISADYKAPLSAFFSSLTFLRRPSIKAACSPELIWVFAGLLWLFLVYCSDISRYGILQPDRVYLHFLFQESVSCNEVEIFTSVWMKLVSQHRWCSKWTVPSGCLQDRLRTVCL